MPAHCRMRAYDRDLIRGGHYGQRPRVPHKQAEHMAAPTNAANVKKVLANSEPSTHGTKRTGPLHCTCPLLTQSGHCAPHCRPLSEYWYRLLRFRVWASGVTMRRRDFVKIVGSAVTWPLMVRAQQPAMPVIGFLSFRSANEFAGSVRRSAKVYRIVDLARAGMSASS